MQYQISSYLTVALMSFGILLLSPSSLKSQGCNKPGKTHVPSGEISKFSQQHLRSSVQRLNSPGANNHIQMNMNRTSGNHMFNGHDRMKEALNEEGGNSGTENISDNSNTNIPPGQQLGNKSVDTCKHCGKDKNSPRGDFDDDGNINKFDEDMDGDGMNNDEDPYPHLDGVPEDPEKRRPEDVDRPGKNGRDKWCVICGKSSFRKTPSGGWEIEDLLNGIGYLPEIPTPLGAGATLLGNPTTANSGSEPLDRPDDPEICDDCKNPPKIERPKK